MTISPVAAPVAVVASGGTSGGSASTDFAALVQQHLADGSAGQRSDERPGGVSGEAAAAMLEAASAPSAVPSDGLAALLAGLLAGTGATRASDASGTSTADGLDGGAAMAPMTTSGGQAPGAGLPDVLPGASREAATSADGMTGTAGALAAELAPVAAGGKEPGRNLPGAPGDDVLGRALGGATATIGGGGAGAGAAGSADGSAASAATVAVADGPGGSAALSGGVTTTPAGAVATGATTGTGDASSSGFATNPITDQVFGQVTRLVSRGDGTHRLTLRLHPADLGEVKVVLTVKDGAVDVTLSAGAAARDALREGSPQLRALLELAGASTGQVTVRDLATGAVTSSTNPGQQQPAGTGADQQGKANSHSASADGQAEPRASADGGSAGDRSGAGGQAGSRLAAATALASTASASTAPSRPTPHSRLDLNI